MESYSNCGYPVRHATFWDPPTTTKTSCTRDCLAEIWQELSRRRTGRQCFAKFGGPLARCLCTTRLSGLKAAPDSWATGLALARPKTQIDSDPVARAARCWLQN